MISFKDHMESYPHRESEETINAWIEGMTEDEQSEWAVKLMAGYPFKEPVPNPDLHEVMNIEEMIFGHFAMIEMVLNSEMEFMDKMHEVVKLILRPTSGTLDNDDPNVEARNEFNIGISDAAYIEDVFSRFLKHRDEIINTKYEGVIYSIQKGDMSEEQEATGSIADAEAKFNSDWYFYKTAKSFVNDDLTRLQEGWDMPMSIALNELAHRAQLQNIESAKARMERAAASFRK